MRFKKILHSGGWPGLACSAPPVKSAAPRFVLFEELASQALTRCSFLTPGLKIRDTSLGCPIGSIATTARDICTSSPLAVIRARPRIFFRPFRADLLFTFCPRLAPLRQAQGRLWAAFLRRSAAGATLGLFYSTMRPPVRSARRGMSRSAHQVFRSSTIFSVAQGSQ